MKQRTGELRLAIQIFFLILSLAAVVFLYRYVRSTEFVSLLAGVTYPATLQKNSAPAKLVELANSDLRWCEGQERVSTLPQYTTAELEICRVPIEAYLQSDGEILLTEVLTLTEVRQGKETKQVLLGNLDREVFKYKALPFRSKHLAERIRNLKPKQLDSGSPNK